jgi:hypothetical protein
MSTPFTLASVATGMKSGVGTLPCHVASVPARAAPSVASSVIPNPGRMPAGYPFSDAREVAALRRSERGPRGSMLRCLRQDLVHHAAVDVGEPEVAAAVYP